MTDNTLIASRIREFQEKNFKSAAEFARALFMKPQSLNVYLSGKSLPGSDVLIKLRDLGCDINWLLTGKSNIIKEPSSSYNSVTQNTEKNQGEITHLVANINGEDRRIIDSGGNSFIIVQQRSIIDDKDSIISDLKKKILSLEKQIEEFLNNKQ
jgi:transcriptional regulator with XRE-family HTH domain